MSERRGVTIVGWSPDMAVHDPRDLQPGEFFIDSDGDLMMKVRDEESVVVAGDDIGMGVRDAYGRRVRVEIRVLDWDDGETP